MWKIEGSIFILLLAYSMRLSDGAFIPFEEDQLEERALQLRDEVEKSEEIDIKRKVKVCRDNCRDTFRKECFNIASIGAFGTPFVGGMLAATGHLRKEDKDENDENNSILKTISPFAAGIAEGLLLLSVYNYEHESPWAEFVEDKFMANCENKCDGGGYKNPIDQENDEKLMKVLNMTIGLAKSGQEYRKFIMDFRSSEEKFHLRDAPKLVKYEHIITRIAFLTQMFEQSQQAKDEEERKMLRDMYLLEARDSDDNDNGLIHSFYMLNQLVTGQTVLGDMFGDFYDSGQSKSVLGLDTSLCNPEQCKKLSRLVSSLIIQLKDVFPDQLDFIDDFIQKSVHDCDKSIRSVCRPIR